MSTRRMSLPRHWSRPSNGHLAWLKSRPVVAAAGVIAGVADLHQHLGRLDAARAARAALTPPTEPIAQTVGCMARAVG